MADQITSLQNPRIKAALRLHRSRGRKQQDRIIIFGKREVARAALAELDFEEIFCVEGGAHEFLNSIPKATSGLDQCLTLVTEEIIEKLSYGDRCEGVVAVARRPDTSLNNFQVADQSVVLVLESVEKPGNVGAVIRSIDATGGTGLLVAAPATDPFHPNAIRSSTGAIFGIPVGTGSTSEVQEWLANNGFRTFSATLEANENLFGTDLTFPKIAFVLGNEAEGLSSSWTESRHHPIRLPMLGTADSLNVSVTSAVMLFEALRQRTST